MPSNTSRVAKPGDMVARTCVCSISPTATLSSWARKPCAVPLAVRVVIALPRGTTRAFATAGLSATPRGPGIQKKGHGDPIYPPIGDVMSHSITTSTTSL